MSGSGHLASMSNVVVLDNNNKDFTPEQSLLQAQARVENMKQVCWMCVNKNGDILTGWSNGPDVHILGMLELVRADVLQRMMISDNPLVSDGV